nr:helix-turn-helix domain-containing protein [uncultured Roseateles sp.]
MHADPLTHTPIAPVWHDVRRTTDVDEHAVAQVHWSMHYDQLSAGPFAGELNHLQLPGVRLVHETVNCAVRQRGHLADGQFGFAMTLDQPGEAYFHGQRHGSESMIIGPSEEFDLASPANLSMVGIVVDGALLNSLWERMYQKPLVSWLSHKLVVQVRPGMAGRLRAAHLAMLKHVHCAPEALHSTDVMLRMRDEILADWMASIPVSVDSAACKSVKARQRVVDRACELMLAQPDQPTTLLRLCSELGATPRKLEYCFRDILGISPVKYLRAVRLNGARRDLKRGHERPSSVQDVAARWGFWHLSDFSAHYRQQFGELPSETLRRAQGLPPLPKTL